MLTAARHSCLGLAKLNPLSPLNYPIAPKWSQIPDFSVYFDYRDLVAALTSG